MGKKKVAFLRLSSLGDVVLAAAALEAPAYNDYERYFVTSDVFGPLLKGHPRIDQLILLRRSSLGLVEWFRFCKKLRDEQIDEIVDLHRTLRTLVLRIFFLTLSWLPQKKTHKVKIRVFSKDRARTLWLFLFKSKKIFPRTVLKRISTVVSADTILTPHFSFHRSHGPVSDYTVMPSAAWPAKVWPAESYLELLLKLQARSVVVLGQNTDSHSVLLTQLLRQKLGHDRVWLSAEAGWGLSEIAGVMKNTRHFVGSDSGFMHLAESVGVATTVIYGATDPRIGFGPWGELSKVVTPQIRCHPCGKDGSFCYRRPRFQCLNTMSVEQVLRTMKSSS